MALHRWLGIWFVVAIGAAFSACSGGGQATTGSPATGSGGSSGGGGASPVSVASSTGAGGEPDAGPIVCKSPASYSTVPKGTCDILQQTCPAGETCAPVQEGNDYATGCLSNTGLKTAGEDCTVNSECDAKLLCLASKCTPVCCRDTDEPCNGGICDVSVMFGQYNIFVCHFAQKCTLLTANACPSGLDCHIEDPSQGLATCGSPNGKTVPDLAPCMFLNDCADMEQCFGGDGACHFYCTPNQPNLAPGLGGCPAGQGCQTTYEGSNLGLGVPGVGLCFSNG